MSSDCIKSTLDAMKISKNRYQSLPLIPPPPLHQQFFHDVRQTCPGIASLRIGMNCFRISDSEKEQCLQILNNRSTLNITYYNDPYDRPYRNRRSVREVLPAIKYWHTDISI